MSNISYTFVYNVSIFVLTTREGFYIIIQYSIRFKLEALVLPSPRIGLLIVEAIDALEGSYIPSSTSLALIIKKASAEQTGSRGKLHFFPSRLSRHI